MYRILHSKGICVIENQDPSVVMDEVFTTLFKLSSQTEDETVYCIVVNSQRQKVCSVTMNTKTLQTSFSH